MSVRCRLEYSTEINNPQTQRFISHSCYRFILTLPVSTLPIILKTYADRAADICSTIAKGKIINHALVLTPSAHDISQFQFCSHVISQNQSCNIQLQEARIYNLSILGKQHK